MVILHELAHLKRHNTQANGNYLCKTSESIQGEAGFYYEESLFGFRIGLDLDLITEEMALKILDVTYWEDEDKLKKIFEDIKIRDSGSPKKNSNSRSMIKS